MFFFGNLEQTLWELGEYKFTPPLVGYTPHSMDPVAWFLQIPPNPRHMRSTSTVSRLSSLFLHSPRSEPDDIQEEESRLISPPTQPSTSTSTRTQCRKTPARSVTWSTHVEEWRQPPWSVSWSAQVEVLIIPVREECAPNDCDAQCVISTRIPHDEQGGNSISCTRSQRRHAWSKLCASK